MKCFMRLNNVTFGYATIDNLEILVLLNTRISFRDLILLPIFTFNYYQYTFETSIATKMQ